MRETLGDRIRAKREDAKDRTVARAKTYIDNQIAQAKAVAFKYVDNRIAKLCEDNDLTPP
jgi:hypothetical protein